MKASRKLITGLGTWIDSIWNSHSAISRLENWAQGLVVFSGIAAWYLSSQKESLKDTIDRNKENKANLEIANANKQAEEAVLGQRRLELAAAQFDKEQTELEQQNLLLQSKVEQERTARLAIEERLAPRVLTDELNTLIKAKLERFAGQKVAFLLQMDDAEARFYGFDLQRALKEAGWLIVDTHHTMGAIITDGVVVGFHADDTNHEAAEALVAVLHSFEIKAEAKPQAYTFTPTFVPQQHLLIYVGRKPSPTSAKGTRVTKITP